MPSDRILHKYTPFHYQLWAHLHDLGVLSIDQLMLYVPPGTTNMHTRHRQRVTNALHDMVKEGDAVRAGRGYYAAYKHQVPVNKKFNFSDRLQMFLKERGRVHFNQLVEKFASRTPGAIRAALYRLQKKGIVAREGQTWCWTANIVQLDKKRQELRVDENA